MVNYGRDLSTFLSGFKVLGVWAGPRGLGFTVFKLRFPMQVTSSRVDWPLQSHLLRVVSSIFAVPTSRIKGFVLRGAQVRFRGFGILPKLQALNPKSSRALR